MLYLFQLKTSIQKKKKRNKNQCFRSSLLVVISYVAFYNEFTKYNTQIKNKIIITNICLLPT